MKKFVVLSIVVVVVLAMASMVFAVPAGKTVEFAGGAAGKVVFSGDVHKAAGACNACHPALFAMKKGTAKITMADINAGKSCGTCHNGTKAFAAKECAKCHKK